MKTYSAHYDNGKVLFEKQPANQLFNLVPGGSVFLSGNSTKTDGLTGKVTTIIKARYRHGCETFEITEDPEEKV